VRRPAGAPLGELLDAAGPGALPLRRLLRRLDDGAPRDAGALVEATGVPYRAVEAVLAALGEEVPPELLPPEPPPAPLAEVERILAGAPPPLRDLDHVPASSETVLGRARWLAETYDLERSRVLFLGDHDCTGLALALVAQPREIAVADVDQRVLEYARSLRTYFADLRIGLPESAERRYDIVFTDPPYTPAGVGLFCARAVEALRDPHTGRIVLAYGFPESQPALGLKVQRELAALELVSEAQLPGFNRYAGAQAIGARADLYALRPTKRSARLAPRRAEAHSRALYTHGRQAVESGGTPGRVLADGHELTLRELIRGEPRPQARKLTVDLRPFHGRCLLQACLAAWTPELEVTVDNDTEGVRSAAEQDRLRRALAPVYAIEALQRSHAGSRDTVLRLARQPDVPPEYARERVIDLPLHLLG
jgi:N4-bis(aminopropyl)spermidine synthase